MSPTREFVLAHTAIVSPPLVPEIRLRLATEVTALWAATERWLGDRGVPPPFWAFAWPGGQALARYVLDHPGAVAGRRVLDFASGSGLVAIAAARAGAAHVVAADVDPFAIAACELNAAMNGAAIETREGDAIGGDLEGVDVVLAGDVCYEQPASAAIEAWLRGAARSGRSVLLGDPGRTYRPRGGLDELGAYRVPVLEEVESREEMTASVYRVAPAS